MYKTLSTKDVDVSARVAMFGNLEQKNKGDEKKPTSESNTPRKDRILDQLHSATALRDRLLMEYSELTRDKTMPLESLHKREFELKETLQSEITVQKIMKLEMEIQKFVEENRNLESTIEDLKKPGQTRVQDESPVNVIYQLSRKTDDTAHVENDAVNTPSEINEVRKQTSDLISGEIDSLQEMIHDDRNAEAMQSYNRHKTERQGQRGDTYDSLTSVLEHPENQAAVGKTFYKKHLNEDMSLWEIKEESDKTGRLPEENREEKKVTKTKEKSSDEMRVPQDTLYGILHSEANVAAINEGNEGQSRKQRDFASSRYDTLQSMLNKPENLDAIADEEENIKTSEVDEVHIREKEIQHSQIKCENKEEEKQATTNNKARDEQQNVPEVPFDPATVQQDTLSRLLHSEANANAIKEENERQSRERGDIKSTKYSTLQSILHKPENQAVIEDKEKKDVADSTTPLEIIRSLETEIKILSDREANQKTDAPGFATAIELIKRLETEMKALSEREANRASNFESELKLQKEKYTDLQKKCNEKEEELLNVKTELKLLKQEHQTLLSKLQDN